GIDLFNYLKKVEEGFLIQGQIENLSFKKENNKRYNGEHIFRNQPHSFSTKWCKFHRMKSHNTEDCYLSRDTQKFNTYMNNKAKNENQINKSRSLIISETRNEKQRSIEIDVEINSTPTTVVLDSGSDANYISEEAVRKYNCNVEEANPISLVFSGGEKDITNRRVIQRVIINDKPYTVAFYVVEKLPVEFIFVTT
ncbi:hypothetical protein NGRA_3417, partial [Nosema granulosis]